MEALPADRGEIAKEHVADDGMTELELPAHISDDAGVLRELEAGQYVGLDGVGPDHFLDDIEIEAWSDRGPQFGGPRGGGAEARHPAPDHLTQPVGQHERIRATVGEVA